MICPRRVLPGATIGVVTVATPAETRGAVQRGVEWWESHGFRVKLGRSTQERGGDFAGPPELRAADLQEMFADPEVAAIQTMRGGYGTVDVLPLLDYRRIAETPKVFVGISDVTYLHLAFARQAGLVTFYGPSLTMVGARPVPTLMSERLLRVIQGDGTGLVPYDEEGPHVRAIAGGRASGPLVGGCLPDLSLTVGTPWEIQTEGAILFFEVQGYGPTFVERHIIHLEQAGKLDGVVGVLVGELPYSEWGEGIGPDWPRERTVDDVLDARLGNLGIPVLYGLPVGHGEAMVTLPLGTEATLDADARRLTIDAPALEAA
jgi:muramoyltetrapeptide carboxypeptidase